MSKTPDKISIHGVPYKLVLLRVETKSVRGIPLTLTLVEDEQTITITPGMEFITAYTQKANLEGTI